MEHTLLSSNQVRANDVTLWEHPCNSYHGLSIYNPSSDHPVPLHMDGIVCFTETCAPTDEEIRDFPHVELTSSVEWKPSEATYNLHSLGEGYVGKRRKVSFADTVKGAFSKDVAFVPQGLVNLDPNLWCSPILGEHPLPSVPVPFPVPGFSSSDSSLSNISSVLSSSFSDHVTTLHPTEIDLKADHVAFEK